MGADKIKSYMSALPESSDERLLGYWPLDEGEGDTVSNLKAGASDAVPLGNGFFMWNKGVNMPPAITDIVKPIAFVISIR